MKKIRILHTLCRVFSGGVEQLRLVLARGLPRDNYEHLLICQEATGALPKLLRNEGWIIRETGLATRILSPTWHSKAIGIARDFSPDIIHGAVIEGVALANVIGLTMPGVPVISEETSDPINRSWRGNLLMRGMCLRSNVVIGVSPKVGNYLRDIAKIPAHKVRVINNAVLPAPEISTRKVIELKSRFGLDPHTLVVGSVGRIQDDHKRFSDLIHAIAHLRVRWPSVRLLIIGDGPDVGMLSALASELGVHDIVIFAGYQGDIRQFYPLMDIFSLASAHEAFGLVLVEAMLAGVPVVATKVGGIPFVLNEGQAGLLVPPKSPETLATAISELLENKNQRILLGALGKKRAEHLFSAQRYCDEIDSLYQSLIA